MSYKKNALKPCKIAEIKNSLKSCLDIILPAGLEPATLAYHTVQMWG